MNRKQFEENEQKLKAKVATATYRHEKAKLAYDDYKGSDTAEEHRLFLCETSAESARITAEKNLLVLQTDYKNSLATA